MFAVTVRLPVHQTRCSERLRPEQVQKLEEGLPGYRCKPRVMHCEEIGTFIALVHEPEILSIDSNINRLCLALHGMIILGDRHLRR